MYPNTFKIFRVYQALEVLYNVTVESMKNLTAVQEHLIQSRKMLEILRPSTYIRGVEEDEACIPSSSSHSLVDGGKGYDHISSLRDRETRDGSAEANCRQGDGKAIHHIYQVGSEKASTSEIQNIFQLFRIQSLSSRLTTFFKVERKDISSTLSDHHTSQSTSNVCRLQEQLERTSRISQHSNYRSVQEQCPDRTRRRSFFINSGCDFCFGAAKEALQTLISLRAKEVATVISAVAYDLLEPRMLEGGCKRLMLVFEDLDIFHARNYHIGDEESYGDVLEILQAEFKIEYSELIPLFASEDVIIFVSRNEADPLMYAFDETDYNLLPQIRVALREAAESPKLTKMYEFSPLSRHNFRWQ